MYKNKERMIEDYNCLSGENGVVVDIQNRPHEQLAENSDILADGVLNIGDQLGVNLEDTIIKTSYNSHEYISDGMSILNALTTLDKALANIYLMTVTVAPSGGIDAPEVITDIYATPQNPYLIFSSSNGVPLCPFSISSAYLPGATTAINFYTGDSTTRKGKNSKIVWVGTQKKSTYTGLDYPLWLEKGDEDAYFTYIPYSAYLTSLQAPGHYTSGIGTIYKDSNNFIRYYLFKYEDLSFKGLRNSMLSSGILSDTLESNEIPLNTYVSKSGSIFLLVRAKVSATVSYLRVYRKPIGSEVWTGVITANTRRMFGEQEYIPPSLQYYPNFTAFIFEDPETEVLKLVYLDNTLEYKCLTSSKADDGATWSVPATFSDFVLETPNSTPNWFDIDTEFVLGTPTALVLDNGSTLVTYFLKSGTENETNYNCQIVSYLGVNIKDRGTIWKRVVKEIALEARPHTHNIPLINTNYGIDIVARRIALYQHPINHKIYGYYLQEPPDFVVGTYSIYEVEYFLG